MYQEILSALSENKTTHQHINTMGKLYNCTTDTKLKQLIEAYGSQLEISQRNFKEIANRKTKSQLEKKINVAKAKAMRSECFIPSSLPTGSIIQSTIKALIDYCQSKI